MLPRLRALLAVGPSTADDTTVLSRVRWRFVLLNLTTALLLPLSLPHMTATSLGKAGYVASVLALAGWAVWLYRSAGRHRLLDLVGPALVAAIGVVSGHPFWAFGPMYLAVFLHSLYGSRRRVFRNAALYVVGYQVAVVVAEGATALFSDQLVSTLLSVGIMAWVMAEMATSLWRTGQSRRRDRVLGEASRRLLRATDPTAVAEAAVAGVAELVAPDCPIVRSELWWRDGDELRLVAQLGPPVTFTRIPLDALPVGPVRAFLDNRTVRLGPRQMQAIQDGLGLAEPYTHGLALPLADADGPAGLIFIEGTQPVDPDAEAALQRFADEVLLADRSVRRNQLLAAVLENSPDGMVLVDSEGLLRFASPAVSELAGRRIGVGEPIGALLAVVEGDTVRAPDDLADLDGAGTSELGRSDGTRVEVEVSGRRIPGVGTVLNIRDVSEQRRLQAEVRHRAFHDPVTELPNRALFLDRLTHTLARAARDHHRFAVALVDLDDFKAVNDRWGHLAGDALLQHVGEAMRRSVRSSDTVARLAGDEFAVIFEDLSPDDDPAAVAAAAVARIGEPLMVGDQELTVRVSLGIAVSNGTQSVEQLLSEADLAMYAAKGRGKGQIVVFDPALRTAVEEQRALREELGQAIESDQLVLHYQPVVRLGDNAPVGVESLVRWQHPERGLLQPCQFVPIAEESGQAGALGTWVLRTACRDLAGWRAAGLVDGTFQLHVNVSARQLVVETFAHEVARALADHDLSPAQLVIEVTETALADSPEQAEQTLRQLHQTGVGVAIDDFGTGYASFTYLRRFPVDIVKIDRSFVADVDAGPEQSALARAIVKLARSLGMITVAEGVERDATRKLLTRWGCTQAQGWLWSPALAEQDLRTWLTPTAVTLDAPTVDQ